MLHEYNKRTKIEIKNSGIKFEDLLSKQYFPQKYIEDIKRANVVLIPQEGFRTYEQPVFPEITRDFLEYLRDEVEGTEAIVDICIDDEEYSALELHSEVVNIPTMIVSLLVLPLIVNVTSNYINNKMNERRSDLNMRVTIHVQEKDDVKTIEYTGRAEDFKETIEAIATNLFEEKR